ncbi:MAG: hypothetical protein IIT98_01405 [Kiritimatiellae bacterium]|nr:hypothetical protein [Kiritimatiellia bacterium]
MTFLLAGLLLLAPAPAARAESVVLGGVEYECADGMCVPAGGFGAGAAGVRDGAPAASGGPRLAQGYMDAADFIAFLDGAEQESAFEGMPVWLMLLAVLAGGFCLNMTPCVLPMVPVTLMVVGRSPARGLLYAAGLAAAYGALGFAASAFGLSFGAIQGDPWFNASISALFVLFALAMCGAVRIDFSRRRNSLAKFGGRMAPGLFAFFMGIAGAVLAGACVAPVVLAVLAESAVLASSGRGALSAALPFVLGAGMALPWPFAAAGMKILPRPGAWMRYVNFAFAAVVLCFAGWYGRLAWNGFAARGASAAAVRSAAAPGDVRFSSPAEFSLKGLKRPVLVDCWASWCKNCAAMEGTTLADEAVRRKLEGFTVVRLRAENIEELVATKGFEKVKGLPAFAVFE